MVDLQYGYPIGTSIKAFFKGIETWKKETILKQVLVFIYIYHKLKSCF